MKLNEIISGSKIYHIEDYTQSKVYAYCEGICFFGIAMKDSSRYMNESG